MSYLNNWISGKVVESTTSSFNVTLPANTTFFTISDIYITLV